MDGKKRNAKGKEHSFRIKTEPLPINSMWEDGGMGVLKS